VRGHAYRPVPLPLQPTLAVRAGASRAWGDYPFQEAAYLGGSSTLRGYHSQRFVGDAAIYGNAELRVPLTRANLYLARGDLGVLALADAGRVYLSGESSNRWHTAAGGGLWFRVLEQPYAASVLYARGEESRFYLNLGLPF
jgi:hemolysin activation/secretion protein